jgi:hypothetical protein
MLTGQCLFSELETELLITFRLGNNREQSYSQERKTPDSIGRLIVGCQNV